MFIRDTYISAAKIYHFVANLAKQTEICKHYKKICAKKERVLIKI